MGATVLMIANALYGLSAAGMVLIEPILLPAEFYQGPMRVDEHPLAARAIKRTNYWRDRDDALNYLRSRTLFQGWDEEMLELYIRHGMTGRRDGGLELACSPQREAALFMGGRQFDPWPLLPKISCPVLIVEGEKSENRRYHRSRPDPIAHPGLQTQHGERRRPSDPDGAPPGGDPPHRGVLSSPATGGKRENERRSSMKGERQETEGAADSPSHRSRTICSAGRCSTQRTR